MTAALTAVVTATLLIGGIAVAGDDDPIYACAQKTNGQLRVIDAGEQCRPSEVPLSWNAVGPQGPPGVLGFYRVEQVSPVPPNTNGASSTAYCKEGDIAVGGGFALEPHQGWSLYNSSPYPDIDEPYAWHVRADRVPLNTAGTIRSRVMCADLTP